MPVKSCRKNGKVGKKWGDRGKCYTGKSAASKAKRQGRAIKANQARRGNR